jgi:hypothetical protein
MERVRSSVGSVSSVDYSLSAQYTEWMTMDEAEVDARQYFDDLTPARCDLLQIFPVVARVVGFHKLTKPFPIGAVPERFRRRLRELADLHASAIIRGYYMGWEHDIPADFEPSGSALIGVRSPDGELFIAPTSIVYLVERHGYMPPACFQQAVLDGTPVEVL